MPFRSEAQRRYLWANHPEIAARWSKKYGSKPMAIPPQFLKGKGAKPDPKAEAKKKVAAARLAKMKGKKGGKVPMVPDTDMDGH